MRYLTAGLLLAAALPALADGRATLESRSDEQNATLEARWASERLRLDFPDQAEAGYMLLRDGKGYVITEMQGQPIVMDMAMLKELAEGLAGGLPDEASTGLLGERASEVVSLEATGETETIAGIEGDVYRISWMDEAGASHDDELVLSDDARVRELMAIFHTYQQTLTGTPDPIATALESRRLGMLRFGDRFRITAISDESPADDAFALPEGATSLQDMLKPAISD